MDHNVIKSILDRYHQHKMGQKIHEDFENLMDELEAEYKKNLCDVVVADTIKINVQIEVPANWEQRLDQQPIIEQQIKEDKWSWNFVPERTTPIQLERICLSKGCTSLVSFIEGARYVEGKLGLWD